MMDDVRYAFRMLTRNSGFSLLVRLTLAIGIGANTSLFTIVNSVLLNPLSFSQPEQLVGIHQNKPGFVGGSIPFPNFRDWERDNHTFSAMAISRGSGFTLTGVGDAEQLPARVVSSDYFTILDMKPVVGRNFARGEDEPNAAPVAMISEGLWKRKFNGSPDIVGRNITLDGRGFTVIGVAPSKFLATVRNFESSDVFVPVGQWKNSLILNRGAGLGFHGIGRLKAGVSIEQARADMEQVTRNLERAYPEENKSTGANIRPLKEETVGRVRPLLLLLLGAVGFVLLIACVNVANLLLARSTARTREFAIRAALGASQGRMLRQLLTESILLALIGGGAGLLMASWVTRAAASILESSLPRATEIQLDGRVLLFTTVVSVLAGILFGLVPALKASLPQVYEMLKEGGRGASGNRHRAQGAFIVAEMAMAVVLLIGAGLMIRTLSALWNTDTGFRADNVLTFGMSMSADMTTSSPEAIRSNFRALNEQIASTPGVQHVSQSWAAIPMLTDDEIRFWLQSEEKPATQGAMKWALKYVVDPAYLQVMQLQLLRGRFFTEHDDEHAPLVAVIDDALAHRYFGSEEPFGKVLNFEGYEKPVEIIGVVGHVNQWGLDVDAQHLLEQVYLPFMQMPDETMKLAALGSAAIVRVRPGTPDAFDAIHRSLTRVNPGNTVYGAETMNQIIADTLANRRFSMIMLEIFAALALLLASIGIYGVISYVVGQRTHEFGVRMALGARATDILKLVLSGGGKLALIGIGIGLFIAPFLTQLMKSLISGVGAIDPLTYGLVTMLLMIVALAACWLPARRATKVDPMVALRYE